MSEKEKSKTRQGLLWFIVVLLIANLSATIYFGYTIVTASKYCNYSKCVAVGDEVAEVASMVDKARSEIEQVKQDTENLNSKVHY